MSHVWHDLETRSRINIRDGTYKYAEEAEILLWVYAIGDGEVRVWDLLSELEMPGDLAAAIEDPQSVHWSHTAFDRIILKFSRTPLMAHVPIRRWRDVTVLARLHGLPGALEKLCTILKVPNPKISGKEFIKLFCVPTKDGGYNDKWSHPEKWDEFVKYATRDVVSMREVAKRIPNWNYRGRELELWHLDQIINDRGFQVDTELAEAAMAAVGRIRGVLNEQTQELTWDPVEGGAEVEQATQRDRLLEHILKHYGVELPDMRAATVEKRLDDPDIPDVVKELLVLRSQAALTSSSKYAALLKSVCTDGALRGTLLFAGAQRTARWAGKLFQPQNLMRIGKYVKKFYDEIADAIKTGAIDLLYEKPMELIGQLVRGAIVARKGKRLAIADLANIEGRLGAWFAGEDWKIEAFKRFDKGEGPDLYVLAYSTSFGVKPDVVIADDEAGGTMRQVGKVQELALQFQGAVGAFQSMAAVYGITLPDEEALRVVKATRKAQPNITSMWYELEGAVRYCIENPGETRNVRGKLAVLRTGNWLRITLPSGRALCYPAPMVDEDGKISYLGVCHYTHQWRRIYTYGGKLFENVVQATARDVLADAMPRAEAAGYEIVLHVHDELVTEVPEYGDLNGAGLAAIMATLPKWAVGLPLAAKGYDTQRYRKG